MIKDFKNCGILCKIMGILLIVFVLVLICYYSASTTEKMRQADYIGRENNVISVSKTGTVYAVPNLAQISFSIITEKKEVGDALKINSEKASAVIEVLKAQGISETDIKTTYFYVSPLYEWRKAETDISSSGERVLVGYEARETLEVKVRDIEKVSSIIDGSVGAGANEVSDLKFVVENEEAFKTQARTKAIIDARAEATQTAQSLGVKLGEIVSFTENSYYPYYDNSMKMLSSAGAGEVAAPVSTGENKIQVTVNVVFEIK